MVHRERETRRDETALLKLTSSVFGSLRAINLCKICQLSMSMKVVLTF